MERSSTSGVEKAIHPSSSEIVRKQFRGMLIEEKINDGKVTDCTEQEVDSSLNSAA